MNIPVPGPAALYHGYCRFYLLLWWGRLLAWINRKFPYLMLFLLRWFRFSGKRTAAFTLNAWEKSAARLTPAAIYTALLSLEDAAAPADAALLARAYLFVGNTSKAGQWLRVAQQHADTLNATSRYAFAASGAYLAQVENDADAAAYWRLQEHAPEWVKSMPPGAAANRYPVACVRFGASVVSHNFVLRGLLEIVDQCPCCGHQHRFSTTGPTPPWLGESGSWEWLCPHCLAERYWDREQARTAAFAYFEQLVAALCRDGRPMGKAAACYASILAQALAPVALIRMGRPIEAIGHQNQDTWMYLLQRLNSMTPPSLDYLDYRTKAANGVATRMWDRSIRFLALDPALDKTRTGQAAAALSGAVLFSHRHKIEFADGRDDHNMFQRGDLPWPFTIKEMAFARKNLAEMGVPADARIACLLVRDSMYDREKRVTPYIYPHRNADINAYQPGMEFLASQGWYVLRMGSVVEKSLAWRSEKIIDYALEFRTEFMDVWLMLQCGMVVSTGAGLDSIATMVRKPLVYTNFPNVYWSLPNYSSLFILHKHFFKKPERRELTKYGMMASHCSWLHYDNEYKGLNIGTRENTADEITAAVREVLEWVEGRHTATDEDVRSQKQFWETLAWHVPFMPKYAPLRKLCRQALRTDPDFGPSASAEHRASLPRVPLPWDEPNSLPFWRPSGAMVAAALQAASLATDPEEAETLLLSCVWCQSQSGGAEPGQSALPEVYAGLATLYKNQGYLKEALFFFFLCSFVGGRSIPEEEVRNLYTGLFSDAAVPFDAVRPDFSFFDTLFPAHSLLVDGNVYAAVKRTWGQHGAV